MIWLASAAAVTSVLLGVRPGAAWVRGRLHTGPGASAALPKPVRLLIRIAPPVLGVALLGWVLGGRSGAVAAVTLTMITGTIMRVAWAHRTLRTVRKRRAEVVQSCACLAGYMKLGHVPAVALARAAADCPILEPIMASQLIGGDVAATFRECGLKPGAEGLIEVADAWQITQATGASLTAAMDAVAQRQLEERALTRLVAAELAAPRATGRLLAALPLLGMGMGTAFGGNPVIFLLSSAIGNCCLLLGVALVCTGVLWSERLADRAGAQ